MTQHAPVRLAIVGGRRGAAFQQIIALLEERVRLVAICDSNDDMLANWQARYPDILQFRDYNTLLQSSCADAVLLATPLPLHAKQAIQALKAGKHVLSEVTAAYSIEECWELVEAVEQTGLTYMLAENYCYMRSNMMIRHMTEQGLFGELTYLEGAYIHDSRVLTHLPDESLTWRGDLRRICSGNSYPTHSLGPIAQWLGINRPEGDQFESLVTFMTGNAAAQDYYREFVSANHPGTSKNYWRQGDSSTTLIRTRNGVVVDLRLDWASSRPHNLTHYALQGTKGAYLAARHSQEEPLIWLKGRSFGLSNGRKGEPEAEWEPLWNYGEEYEHPLWEKWSGEAATAGHGGGDFFVIAEFITAISEHRQPAIDVYDAVAWSCVTPLSIDSVAGNGKTMMFPDFSRGRKK